MTVDEIINRYNSGESTVKISKDAKCSPSVVRYYLIKNGITLRSNKVNSRVYDVDHSYFHNIDTLDKAYWLGFLSADGYVTKTKTGCKSIGIAIKSTDKKHLEKYNNALHGTYPIYTYTSQTTYSICEYCRVIIRSDNVFDDLVAHGVLERKTNRVEFPKWLKHELIPHYLRGYFDGDGCITHSGKSPVVKLCATQSFLEDMCDYLDSKNIKCNRRFAARHSGDITLAISLSGERAFRLLQLMYCGNNVSLDRKCIKYCNAKEYYGHLYQE